MSAPAARRKRAKYRRAKDSDDELDENDELEDYLDAQDAVRLVRDPLTVIQKPAASISRLVSQLPTTASPVLSERSTAISSQPTPRSFGDNIDSGPRRMSLEGT